MKSILFGFLVMLTTTCFGQEWKNLGTDQLFQLAREEAFEGKRKQAREKLNFILESSPNYADVRILLARTYAWDGQRDLARKELQQVLETNPIYQDAINASIDVEMWDEAYDEALRIANLGLKYYPTFEGFIYKKASILNFLGRHEEAMTTINHLLDINPADQRAIDLRKTLETKQMRYRLGLHLGADFFSDTFDPAYYTSLQLARSNNWGTSIIRANYANRFQSNGIQGEIDLYPKITKGVYGYLNYGYSASSLFPKHRIGAEVFSKLPKSFEASFGLRHLIFDNSVTIYTGSLGWYHKSMWWSLRPFITPDERAGTSVSGSMTLRRYFSNPNNYLELSSSMGFSPDIRTIQSADGLSQDQLFRLRAQRIGAGFQYELTNRWLLNGNLDFTRQELAYNVGKYVIITSILARLNYRF